MSIAMEVGSGTGLAAAVVASPAGGFGLSESPSPDRVIESIDESYRFAWLDYAESSQIATLGVRLSS